MRYSEIREDFSPALLNWFKGSKIFGNYPDEPAVCHHFTYTDFDVFDRHYATHRFKRDPERIDTVGLWFTTNPDVPYANTSKEWGGKRLDCFLRVLKPLYYDDGADPKNPRKVAWEIMRDEVEAAGGATKYREQLKARGYDGVVMADTNLDGHNQTVIIVLEPNQIKAVDASSFDSDSDDFRA